MMDWASFGWGMFAAACLIVAGEWLLYHYWPRARSRDGKARTQDAHELALHDLKARKLSQSHQQHARHQRPS